MPFLLGGDHSITLPEVAALAAHHGPVGLIHFDTHTDTAAELWGQKLSHGTPMYRMVEDGHVDPTRYVQIGLRGYWPGEDEFAWQRDRGITSFFAHDVRDQGIRAIVEQTLAIVGEGPVMLTVDVDVLDPAVRAGHRHPGAGRSHLHRAAAGLPPDRLPGRTGRRRRGRGGSHGRRIGRHHRAGGRARRARDPDRDHGQARRYALVFGDGRFSDQA